MFFNCEKCGARVSDNMKFCWKCGWKAGVQAEKQIFKQFDVKAYHSRAPKFYIAIAGITIVVVAGGLLLLSFSGVVNFSALLSSGPPVAGVTRGNKEHAKAAINAIGEINSVASVGANYMQYTSAVQSAKIKFDAALRDFESPTKEEELFIDDLETTFECYTDAASAWNEFIQDGDGYGFVTPKASSQLPRMERRYGFQLSGSGQYFREEVVGSMLRSGARNFYELNQKIK